MSVRSFVIGDVHGCALTLRQLLFKVIRIRTNDHIYFLGDLIDRGPRSREVLDIIIRLRSAGYNINSVRGNHEEMLLNACHNRNDSSIWLKNGGLATLHSFNVEDACEIPLEYRKFLAGFPYYILLDNFILCHAGINCDAVDPLSDTETMLWNRNSPFIPARLGNRKLICGHTVKSFDEISASLATERIFLDGGCVFKEHTRLGYLAALELENMNLHYVANADL